MKESNFSESNGGSGDEIDLRQLLFSLLVGKWVILGCLLAGLAVGLAYLQFTTPVFRATALLEVPEQRENAAGFEVQDYTGDEVLKTIERNLRRISLIGRVVERENIGGSAAFQASFEDSPDIQGTPREWELVAEWVTISLERGTRLINISVEHTDRMLARDLANALVEEFIRERSEKRSGFNGVRRRFAHAGSRTNRWTIAQVSGDPPKAGRGSRNPECREGKRGRTYIIATALW